MRVGLAPSRSSPPRRRSVFRAFVDPDLLVVWLPPDGMTGRLERFDARGGGYRMVLTYDAAEGGGKSTADADVVEVRRRRARPPDWVVRGGRLRLGRPRVRGDDDDDVEFSSRVDVRHARDRPSATDVPAGICRRGSRGGARVVARESRAADRRPAPRHPEPSPRSESATSRSASAERGTARSSFGANCVSRIGTAPAALTIDGTDSATPSTPWKSRSTGETGMTACSSLRIASMMRALDRPIA